MLRGCMGCLGLTKASQLTKVDQAYADSVRNASPNRVGLAIAVTGMPAARGGFVRCRG
jgi:hypothetical protein